MSEQVIASGIEANFVESWEGWDDLGDDMIQFYNVKLKKELFPTDLHEMDNLDLVIHLSLMNPLLEIHRYDENGNGAVLFTKELSVKFKEE